MKYTTYIVGRKAGGDNEMWELGMPAFCSWFAFLVETLLKYMNAARFIYM